MSASHDLRHAWRVLRKSPAFALTAIGTLGVAIGVNGAVFTLAQAVLLAPLPYTQPEHLALVSRTVRQNGRSTTGDDVNGRTWELARDSAGPFDRAAYSTWTTGVNLAIPGTAGGVRYVQQQRVGSGFFRVLGVAPLHGREIAADEDRPGGPAVVLLSHALWTSTFAGDPGAIGRSILLRGEPFTIVGIMPAGFHSGERADLWTPLRPSAAGEGGGENYRVMIRYRDGGAHAEAADTIARLGRQLQREAPASDGSEVSLSLRPLHAAMSSQLRQPILILWAAVAIVLVAACVNLAGVMLARTTARRREFATRLALGSSRGAIVRQLTLESVVLGLAGGIAGSAIGFAALDGLTWLAGDAYEIWRPVRFGAPAVAVAITASVAASILFGIGPAIHASRSGTGGQPSLAGGRTVAGRTRHWPRRVLVVAQVALGVVLLSGSGLLLRTFVHLRNLDPGFDPDRLMAASVSLEDARYRTADSVARLLEATIDRIQRTPGVEAAGASLGLPYQRLLNLGFRYVDGAEARDARGGQATSATYVTPGFFAAMRLPILNGRAFDARDRAGAMQVAIVNGRFARTYFGGGDPIGRRIRISGIEREIVGVANDVQVRPGWGDFGPLSTMPLVYVPLAQVNDGFVRLVHGWFQPAIVIRASLPQPQTMEAVRRAVESADPLLPLASFRSLSDVRAAALAEQRLLMTLLLTLAAAALLVAALGIHGLIATTVTERTREMGIRLALGSTSSAALRTLALPGVTLAAVGTGLGVAGAVAASRLFAHFVWGVSTTDPLTFTGVAVVLLTVAAAASLLPARRILRLDPAITLRQE